MATVVITIFLITHFYVCKMDADGRERRRNISRREKRWIMNSQRLEEIVAELMKPISAHHQSFDMDLSALLEEYLTEAGLRALEAREGDRPLAAGVPNFMEAALLLQQSASIYGRKVDFLYQRVLNVSESLHSNTVSPPAGPGGAGEAGERGEAGAAGEAGGAGEAAGAVAASARRRRRASVLELFTEIVLEASAAARREGAPRPPPTLPRLYADLEPRVLADCDAPLFDYGGEPIGLMQDFHVNWRLQEGLLVEELAGGGASESSLRALPLTELQAAIVAAAPPCSSAPASPLPLPAPADPPPATPPAAPVRRERKRRREADPDNPDGAFLVTMSKKLPPLQEEEFSVPLPWLQRVVRERAAAVRRARSLLRPPSPEFRGFDISDSADVGGFGGWSPDEAAEAAEAARQAGAAARRLDESDDDGFFERSSLGESDRAWRDRVAARAAVLAARGVDVRGAAATVLRAAQRPPAPAPAARVLAAAEDKSDVSRLFLATLFLANAGNVEIVPGPPLSLNSFSLRVLSTDERLYSTAAAADESLLRAARTD